MEVKKRNGKSEPFDISKIKKVISWATEGLDVNPLELESHISINFKDGIKTEDIHNFSIVAANNLTSIENPNMRYVAGRLYIMQHWKSLKRTRGYIYSLKRTILDNCKSGVYDSSLKELLTEAEMESLNSYMNRDRDLMYDMTGAHTLVQRYLLPNENIQEMYMVIAILIARGDVEYTKRIYDVISTGKISLATPILLNLRKPDGNLTSCFILDTQDNLKNIMDVIAEFAFISQKAGAAGIDLSKVRAGGSWIKNVAEVAGGVVPLIKVLNDVSIYVDQQGKRAGSVTPALPVWHLDFYDYLESQTETGDQRRKAHDIFVQGIFPDVFMERLESDGEFVMVDPYEVKKVLGKDLSSVVGEDFKESYLKVEELISLKKL